MTLRHDVNMRLGFTGRLGDAAAAAAGAVVSRATIRWGDLLLLGIISLGEPDNLFLAQRRNAGLTRENNGCAMRTGGG